MFNNIVASVSDVCPSVAPFLKHITQNKPDQPMATHLSAATGLGQAMCQITPSLMGGSPPDSQSLMQKVIVDHITDFALATVPPQWDDLFDSDVLGSLNKLKKMSDEGSIVAEDEVEAYNKIPCTLR